MQVFLAGARIHSHLFHGHPVDRKAQHVRAEMEAKFIIIIVRSYRQAKSVVLLKEVSVWVPIVEHSPAQYVAVYNNQAANNCW